MLLVGYTQNAISYALMPVTVYMPNLNITKPTLIVETLEPKQPQYEIYVMTEEDILEEDRLYQMELLAQLCQAEAGNQGLNGMRYVADVVLNRVEDERFPDSIEEVIYQDKQFSVIADGAFNKAGWYMSDIAYQAVIMEWDRDNRLDKGILYFSSTTDPANGHNAWKYRDHWFSY